MSPTIIDNSQDLLDVRDIIERIEEIELEKQTLTDDEKATKWYEDELEDYNQLTALLDELKGQGGDEFHNGNWYPLTLIRESYFQDYAQELAEDIHGNAITSAAWPFDCIDWDEATNQLQQDYSEADYDGTTYYYR